MKENETLVVRGQTLSFIDDPFKVGVEQAVAFNSGGAVVLGDGKILDAGQASEIVAKYPDARIEDYGDNLIMAGFVDCHTHFPQIEIIGSYGEQLLQWLNKYTFPTEAKFSDANHGKKIARLFLDEYLRNGITSASVYCSVHAESVEAFFNEAANRGLRMAAGKVLMDCNAPDNLLDTAEQGYHESEVLLKKWHGRDRLVYVISPRFALTSSPAQLEAAGQLWQTYPDALLQTHLSENLDEIERAKSLYPGTEDYLAIYERYGFIRPGANFGHAIHLEDREIELLRQSGAGISHCPTSNMFIGSGLFDMAALRDCELPVKTGIATDIGGGSSFSMFQTMKSSYEVCQLRGYSLHPVKAFYLATVGSAEVMQMGDKIGNLRPGYEADLIVVDLKSRPVIAQRMQFAEDLADVLFAQIILADDRAVRATYIGGKKVYDRDQNS